MVAGMALAVRQRSAATTLRLPSVSNTTAATNSRSPQPLDLIA
jgi:hypothetical protein